MSESKPIVAGSNAKVEMPHGDDSIRLAELDWVDGEPRSRRYQDIYFSRGDGLEESEYIFLGLNNLRQRWCSADFKRPFVIAETGLGTGLNLLACLRLWAQCKPQRCCQGLHFVSFEKHPLSRDDLLKAHARWPQLSPWAQAFQALYPVEEQAPLEGLHRLHLDDGVVVDLVFGDAQKQLDKALMLADAWFLDGFHPASNASMWSDRLFQAIAQHSRPGATLSSFTVAGAVRRGLQAVGFKLEKRPGHGRKREVLSARFEAQPSQPLPPWYRLAEPVALRSLIIVGAGLVGLSLQRALARYGVAARLIDARAPFSGASGNPAALIKPPSVSDQGLYGRFFHHAYGYAERELAALGLSPPVIEPQALLGRLLPAIEGDVRIATLAQLRYRDGLWHLFDAQGRCIDSASHVVFASGAEGRSLPFQEHLGLLPARGQVDVFELPGFELEAVFGQPYLSEADHGYVIDLGQGQLLAGASFQRGREDDQVDVADTEENAQRVAKLCQRTPRGSLAARASLRATCPDQLPVIGPLVQAELFKQQFHDLRHGRPAQNYAPAAYHPGLFVSCGFGGKGFTSAWLAAELLACQVVDAPCPLGQDLIQALHPNRFLVRQLKRASS